MLGATEPIRGRGAGPRQIISANPHRTERCGPLGNQELGQHWSLLEKRDPALPESSSALSRHTMCFPS